MGGKLGVAPQSNGLEMRPWWRSLKEMVLHSHVSFVVLLHDPQGAEVTSHLGIAPTEIRQTKVQTNRDDRTMEEKTVYSWHLASPKDASCELTDRLAALVDLIGPLAPKILSLQPSYKRWIDVLYHVAPEKPDTLTGEFFWFTLTPSLMSQLGACKLNISHEIFWFDHPEAEAKRKRSWLPKFFQK
jgi:hypothetical protein